MSAARSSWNWLRTKDRRISGTAPQLLHPTSDHFHVTRSMHFISNGASQAPSNFPCTTECVTQNSSTMGLTSWSTKLLLLPCPILWISTSFYLNHVLDNATCLRLCFSTLYPRHSSLSHRHFFTPLIYSFSPTSLVMNGLPDLDGLTRHTICMHCTFHDFAERYSDDMVVHRNFSVPSHDS